jgi:DNA-binding transcriptional ArsR family regulator
MVRSNTCSFGPRHASLARYAKALSHPARLTILETLAKRASGVGGEIVEVLPLAQSTVSQHLKELKDAGLIRGEVDGPKSCYCLNPKALTELSGLIEQLLKALKRGTAKDNCC